MVLADPLPGGLGGGENGTSIPGARCVEDNLGYVLKVAADYRGLGVPFEELVNEGNVGLVEAARRFDPGHGVKFATYAIWWIRKTILKSLDDHSRTVRLPSYQATRARRVRETERGLRDLLGRYPDREELSRALALSLPVLDRLLLLDRWELSLETTVGEEGRARLLERVPDLAPTPEQVLIRRELSERVRDALGLLPSQERQVLALRYGLDDGPRLSLEQAGKRLGLSRERIRQIQVRATQRLRRLLSARRPAEERAGAIARFPTRA